MGDMADMLIDQMFDDPFGEEEDDDGPAGWTVKCRCCGQEGLVWGQVDGKWRLHDQKANLHACKVKPLPVPPKPKTLTDPIEIAYQKGYDAGYAACAAQAWPDVGF